MKPVRHTEMTKVKQGDFFSVGLTSQTWIFVIVIFMSCIIFRDNIAMKIANPLIFLNTSLTFNTTIFVKIPTEENHIFHHSTKLSFQFNSIQFNVSVMNTGREGRAVEYLRAAVMMR